MCEGVPEFAFVFISYFVYHQNYARFEKSTGPQTAIKTTYEVRSTTML